MRNFFANIADLLIGANNLLQGKPADAVTDWARFAFNTTIGLFGINDVASDMGLEKHDEDFGQTFGRWGFDDGAYLVWPFLGSSSVRDSAGLIPDFHFDPVLRHKPVRVRNTMTVVRAISKRADLLDASRILEEAALDKYVFQRDAYLQRRRSQVYDGNPPRAEREAPRAEADESETPQPVGPTDRDAGGPVFRHAGTAGAAADPRGGGFCQAESRARRGGAAARAACCGRSQRRRLGCSRCSPDSRPQARRRLSFWQAARERRRSRTCRRPTCW